MGEAKSREQAGIGPVRVTTALLHPCAKNASHEGAAPRDHEIAIKLKKWIKQMKRTIVDPACGRFQYCGLV
jgi:hypothetical protein